MIIPLIAWIVFAIFITLAITLSGPAQCRTSSFLWALAGVFLAWIKLEILRSAPQWHDTPLDAIGHALHGEALHLHFNGELVDPRVYALKGYLAGWIDSYGSMWEPTAQLSFASVFGSSEWIYAFTVGMWASTGSDWLNWALMANTAMAGVAVGSSYALAKSLGFSTSTANLAAALMAIDLAFVVNAAWTLKDPLASVLTLVALLLACKIFKEPHLQTGLLLGLTLGCLGAVRYVGMIALLGAIVAALFSCTTRKQPVARLVPSIGTAVFVGCLTWASVYCAPLAPEFSCIKSSLINPISAQHATLGASSGETGHDPTVDQWREDFRADPLKFGLRAIARTLFAPYPWTVINNGLTWDNHIELYLPGMIIWAVIVPFAVIGGAVFLQLSFRKPEVTLVLVFTALIATAYLMFFGEWSTRQRIYMQPVLMIFAAAGINKMLRRCGKPELIATPEISGRPTNNSAGT